MAPLGHFKDVLSRFEQIISTSRMNITLTPLSFDIEEFVQPVLEDAITGTDPRADISPASRYYLLKDIRNSARAKERNALIDEEDIHSIASEWRPILEQVPQSLKDDSKDLEFVAWFIEALCRLHGFKGLAFGFTLAAELIERYWDELFPVPDPDDLSERLAPLIGLNGIDSEGSLIQPIKSILITEGINEGPFSTWQYEQAFEVDRLDEQKQKKRFEAGAISLEALELSIKETPDDFYLQLSSDIDAAIIAFSRLSRAMDNAMNGDPQPTSYISKSLAVCDASIKKVAKVILQKSADNLQAQAETVNETDEPQAEASADNSEKLQQQVNSREQAINNLDKIAEFFRKTEPHSPMSYAIEQVIRWSDLSLPELLQELIVDGEARNGFFKLSGIKTED